MPSDLQGTALSHLLLLVGLSAGDGAGHLLAGGHVGSRWVVVAASGAGVASSGGSGGVIAGTGASASARASQSCIQQRQVLRTIFWLGEGSVVV